jgi:hypothetical protein
MAAWGGHHCLGYDAVSHGKHFPVFQRSIALIQGLEVQKKKNAMAGPEEERHRYSVRS